ncbi:hypothetical protein ACS0TY_010915 [Phlomoides rotata]
MLVRCSPPPRLLLPAGAPSSLLTAASFTALHRRLLLPTVAPPSLLSIAATALHHRLLPTVSMSDRIGTFSLSGRSMNHVQQRPALVNNFGTPQTDIRTFGVISTQKLYFWRNGGSFTTTTATEVWREDHPPLLDSLRI